LFDVSGSDDLEDSCRTHAGADAHGNHAVFAAGAPHAMHRGGNADGAGGAERMAERDGATERIDLCRIDAQFRITAIDCAAKASLSSIQSRSSCVMPTC
jgi:hypothetical protein